MATLRQIAFNVRNIIEGGRTSENDVPSYRQIIFMINYYRALFIRRDLDRNYLLPNDIQQDLGCVKLIEVDEAECCEIATGCNVLRTELKLPKPIRAKNGLLITYVGSVDKKQKFDIILPERAPYIGFSKYTQHIPRVYYLNGYIYITGSNALTYINIRGVWSNPEDVKRFQECEDGECYTDDSEYPMSDDMIEGLTKAILNGEIKYIDGALYDTTNNQVDDQFPQR